MTTWAEFALAMPELAETGRRLIERTDRAGGLLATVRADLPPRINPISVAFGDGRLLAFLSAGSGKVADLEEDGRYAFHTHLDPAEPHEFLVRGRAREVVDAAQRAAVAAGWSFTVDDGYRLFEFSIDHVVFGERADPDSWPPRYTSWRCSDAAS